jgi:(2Fe-2S) ferredoxin
MIFVCTNSRKPGERISCAGQGRCGEEILQKLKDHVKKNKLETIVRVAKSGCQEKCEIGPNLVVLPQGEFVSNLNLEDVDKILDTYFSNFNSSLA